MNTIRDEDDTHPKRRAVIKLLGASAVSMGGLGTVAGRAGADGRNKSSFEFDRINGAEANKTVAAALRSEQYKDLHKTLRKEERYAPKVSEATVIEVEDPEGTPHRIVGFPLKGLGKPREPAEGVEVTADAAITLRDKEALVGKAVRFTSGPRNPETNSTPVSTRSYTAANGTVESSTAEAVIEENPTEADFSTAESTGCFACTTVGDVVCTVGCGLGISIICAGTAVANLAGGFACGIIAGALCGILAASSERYVGAACGADIGIEYACYYAGYCDEPFAG